MATLQSSVELQDEMTPILRKITNVTYTVISSFRSLEIASGHLIDTAQLNVAHAELRGVEAEFIQVEEAMDAAGRQQERLNENIKQGGEEAHRLKNAWNKITGTLETAGIAVSGKELFAAANEKRVAGNTLQGQTGLQGEGLETAKQSMVVLYTDGMGKSLDEVAQSMSAVYQITGQTGTGLEQMTRAGILLSDTFGYDVTESMRTAQIMEEQFGVSGAQAFDLIVQGAQSGLDKNGNLLDTINEYSDQFSSLGFHSTDMFNMLINGAQSGTVSVDKLGEAVKEFSNRAIDGSKTTQDGFRAVGLDADQMAAAFGSGGDMAKQAFQQTVDAISKMDDPVKRNMAGVNLFGTMWEDMGYDGIIALANMNGSAELATDHLEELNNIKYDDATSALASLSRTVNMGLSGVMGNVVNMVTAHMNDFTNGLQGNAGEVQGIFGGIGLVVGIVGGAISDSWSIIEPIIWGVVAALAIYKGYLLANNAIEIISKGLKIAACIASFAYSVATRNAATGTMKHTAAQLGLNASLLACPITWIIIAIIALIAIFYAVIAAVNMFAGTSVSATGIICGAFAFAGAAIWNVLMGVLGIGLGIVGFLINGWVTFANFFANVFNDPVSSVIHLFAGMGDGVLQIIEKIAQAIDFVFGSSLAGTVSGWRDGLSEMADAAAEKYGNGEYEQKVDKFDVDQVMADMGLSVERIEYGNAWDKGYQFGEGAGNKMGGVFDNFKNSFDGDKGSLGLTDAANNLEGIHNNTGNTAGNTAAMADSMDMAEEDLQSMRDMAEAEVINRFTTAELTVNMGGITNQVNSNMDLDGINSYLESSVFEVLETAAEGVY